MKYICQHINIYIYAQNINTIQHIYTLRNKTKSTNIHKQMQQ